MQEEQRRVVQEGAEESRAEGAEEAEGSAEVAEEAKGSAEGAEEAKGRAEGAEEAEVVQREQRRVVQEGRGGSEWWR